MPCFTIPGVKIAGLSACVPRQKVRNSDYPGISEKEYALFLKTVGIEERRIAAANQCASDLCIAAAEPLLDQLGWEKAEIQALVYVSQTPDYLIPGTSSQIQDRLGLPKSCLALDINQGCAGYVYGLSTLAALLSATGLTKAILLVGDTISRRISPNDKSTALLFSDAGSATCLTYDPTAADMHFNLQSDGAGYQGIMVPAGGSRNGLQGKDLEIVDYGRGISRAANHLAMKGVDVFSFATQEVPPNIRQLLSFCGEDQRAIDYFIFHQANLILNESIRKKLEIDAAKVPYSLRHFGNTNCATIPLTMISELGKERLAQKLKLLLSGFGTGLSWGSAIVDLAEVTALDLIEL